jgi:ATP-dependent Clp protease adaptor protein ClpS
MSDAERRTDGDVLERTKPRVQEPIQYRVILHNDDYTTMDFVIEILESIFHKQPAEAFRLMMQVHTQGQAMCGIYPHEVAETKVGAVHDLAREHGFPLRASMESD